MANWLSSGDNHGAVIVAMLLERDEIQNRSRRRTVNLKRLPRPRRDPPFHTMSPGWYDACRLLHQMRQMEKLPMSDPNDASRPSRRNILKGLSLLPIAAAASADAALAQDAAPSQPGYQPSFLSGDEWAFVHAACDRLIPQDEVGPGAVELGVPEFLDRHMQTPYASGAIWYMQGPFLEADPEFGYQGRLALRDMLRVGIRAVDNYCMRNFGGHRFAEIAPADQERVLADLEAGKIQLDEISAKLFFTQLLDEVRIGYFADPKHGGNKGMGSWKMIGYPGMRASYLDWVEVRDRPYPLPPVDLAGRSA